MIPVCYHSNPFEIQPRAFSVEPGHTLLDIVHEVTNQPDLFVVMVNGEPVPMEWWHRVRPKPEGVLIVTLHLKPQSDSITNILTVVATIAVVVGAALISGGALVPVLGAGFAAGTLGATLAAAAVGIAGSLAISALTAPPIASNAEAGGGAEQKSIAGVGLNTIAAGDYLPMVLGTMRVSPPPLMPSYTILEEGEIYVHGIVGMVGAYDVDAIWLNGTPIELFDDVQYDYRQGLPSDSAPSLNFGYSVQEIQPRLKLSQSKRTANTVSLVVASPQTISHSDWHIFNMHPPGDEGKIVMRLHWPGGMNSVQTDNDVVAGGIGVRLRIRPRSSSAWYELPELHFHQNAQHTGEIRQQITLQWQSAITSGTYSVDASETAYYAFFSAAEGQTYPRLASPEYDPGGAAVLAQGVSRDASDGFIIEIDNTVMDGDEEYDVAIRLSNSYTESAFTAGYIYGGSAADADGIFGGSGINDRTTTSKSVSPGEFVYLEAIASWKPEDPFEWMGVTSISFRAKSVQIDSLSALYTSIVNEWDGMTWSNSNPTNNPASLFRFACLSTDFNAQAIPGELLDEENILEWWEHCVDMGYVCNTVIQNNSLPEVLQLIASTGWASPKFSDTWGVVMEKDRSSEEIMQLLTPLNSRDLGTTKEFPRMPHAIRAEYSNENGEHEIRDDVVAYAPGFDVDTATVYESVRYPGFTDPDKVLARAQFDINQVYLRNVRYIRDVHQEGFLLPKGSLLGLSDDVVAQTHRYSMMVSPIITTGGMVTGLQLESLIDLDTLAEDQSLMDPYLLTGSALNTLAVTVRLNDGSPSTHEITEQTASDTVTFATPVADTGQFEHGQIVAIGILGHEYKRVLVMAVEPHSGGEVFRLTLADEAPELHETA